MAAKRPTNAQVKILAWIIHRYGSRGYRLDCGNILDIRDRTVVALERAGWIDRVKFYDDVAKTGWNWFYVTDAGRALPDVGAEIDKMKARDKAEAEASFALDDAAADHWDRLNRSCV